MLDRHGVRTMTFTQPDPIFEHLENELPDAMVIDFNLGGGLTGASVARSLREFLRHSCPPLILVSAALRELSDEDLVSFDMALDKITPAETLIDQIARYAYRTRAARSESRPRSDLIGELGLLRSQPSPTKPGNGSNGSSGS